MGTLEVMKEIDRNFTRYGFFSRQVDAYLRQEGIAVGRHPVSRLMAKMGLNATFKRPRTSPPHPQHPIYPYLLRKMQVDRPIQVPLSSPQAAIAGKQGRRYRLRAGQEPLPAFGGHP